VSFTGKVAFVTGGACGIGAALATKLVDGGVEVWIADRQLDAAQALAHRLGGGAKAHAIELDVCDYPAFERVVAEAVQRSGRIGDLFNNAGIGVGGEVDSHVLRAVLRKDAITIVPAWWKALWYLDPLSPAIPTQAARVTLERLREMGPTAS
jgi:NADP-dependent 3-hydroxy acid dehydrogenase YdfG